MNRVMNRVMDRNRWRRVHVLVLLAAVALFSQLPRLASGIPLGRLLSSDAEWYVALTARMADPAILAADAGFRYASGVKPGVENWLHWLVIGTARATGSDFGSASVALSILTLVAFVLLVYWLMASTLGDEPLAFVIALLCVIPVHALAATTLGFQPLGFLPRDLALTGAVGLLGCYFAALRRGRGLALVFLACGLFANVYILVFAHLAAVLWVAEVIREPRAWRRHLVSGLMFVAGAAPVLAGTLAYLGSATPPDIPIMRMRHPYMMIFPLGDALRTTLRRVLIYAVLTPLAWAVVRRVGTADQQRAIAPWSRVAQAAFAVTLAGIVIENTTTLWPYHISRASVFFILSAMAICATGLYALGVRYAGAAGRAVGLALVALLLLMQSNLPSIYRHVQLVSATRVERQELLDLSDWLLLQTPPAQVVLVPTDVNEDLALTLRVYALRPVFVTFKDGGVSMLDGDKGRDWLARLRAQETALAGSPGALADLMQRERIALAVLRGAAAEAAERSPAFSVVHRAGRFVIVRVV